MRVLVILFALLLGSLLIAEGLRPPDPLTRSLAPFDKLRAPRACRGPGTPQAPLRGVPAARGLRGGVSLRGSLAVVRSRNAAGLRQPPVQPGPGADPLHVPFDRILDVNVRDGMVYYRALQSGRGALDRYVTSLNVPQATYDSWSREAKMAFWVNAYNAAVLQTVVNAYPIRGRSPDYPTSSIRQIPGAFSRRHQFARRSVTLDEIEKSILSEFNEPRLQLALGRGAVGSGRLLSEAYTAARLDGQLKVVEAEFVADAHMLKVDRAGGQVSVTPILSWHSAAFIAAYDPGATGPFAERSPIERALIAFITPHLLPLERELIQQNQFKVVYHPFDWNLNDLTGGAAD